jgi:menaquinone-dependent protoporphyrinogen oxidase
VTVLVTAASRYGATAEIADRIAEVLSARGLDVQRATPGEVDLEGVDAVVVGSAIYAGHWLPEVQGVLTAIERRAAHPAVWLFTSGPVGKPSGWFARKMAASDPIELPDAITATAAQEHRMFAGKLDRRNLRGGQRLALALFRGLNGDFRDWGEIEQWAASIADQLTRNDEP